MPVEIDIDVETLKCEIKKTYAEVSTKPEKDFIFPTGRAWAEDLDYPDELSNVPDTAVASYAGVANPSSPSGDFRRESTCSMSDAVREPKPWSRRRWSRPTGM